MFQRIKNWVWAHKLISLGFLVVIVVVVILTLLKIDNNQEVNPTTEIVKRGDITITVTGTGQVEASDTVDIKPKISGDVTYVGVKVGQEVKAGTLIASLDAREAKIALENAELSLAELIKDPESSTLIQKENAVIRAYNSGWGTSSLAINEISTTLDSLENLYNDYLGYQNVFLLGRSGKDQADLSLVSYYKAKNSFQNLNKFYKTIINPDEIEKEKISELIKKTEETSKLLVVAIKDARVLLDYIVSEKDDQSNEEVINIKENLSTWLSKMNGYVDNLISLENTILESTEVLDDLMAGADEIDIKSAELTLQSKKNDYNDHFIRAPFDGIIAKLTVNVGDEASSSIGTLITKQKVVSISLNEVDIAQIEIGQKVNLTFDAISGLILTGKVSEISSIGTVSSGVVTYDIKIVFDNDDDRIKPGMSTNIEIITASHQNILIIPSGAIKTRNNISSIEVLDELKNIIRKEIKVGISDDTRTEIISGLNEGDQVLVKSATSGISSNSNKGIVAPRGIDAGMPMGGSAIRMMR